MKPTNRRFGVSLQKAISQSWKQKDMRLWKRLKAVGLYLQGHNPQSICDTLDVSRRSIFYWMEHYKGLGIDGLREGLHPGRPMGLTHSELEQLAEILDSGPVAYGFSSGVWTCPRVGHVIQGEFGRSYHEDHVRKILHQLDFSVQRPTKKLARADPQWQQKWIRHTYPALKKTPKRRRRSGVSG